MTFPLPWRPREGVASTATPSQVQGLEAWLGSGLEAFATRRIFAPEGAPATRCVRVWQNRRRWHAYDDDTGEVLATIPNPHNGRPHRGEEVPPCSC